MAPEKLRGRIEELTGFKPSFQRSASIINGESIPALIGEFWTARQRQHHSLHGVSYRACFKPELPRLFTALLTSPADTVFDPFSGRGTTALQSALMGRRVISNDVNPLSRIFTLPRLEPPELHEVEERLRQIDWQAEQNGDIDLSMFYHPATLRQLLNLRQWLEQRRREGREDSIDRWIRMVATNRLSGHSSGFFSVYTLPPNQAASARRQKDINRKRNQKPEERDVPSLILRKSRQLLKDCDSRSRQLLAAAAATARFSEQDAARLAAVADETVDLTVTSPPFLNVVQYAADNWLRCWFNQVDTEQVTGEITNTPRLAEWRRFIGATLGQLHRVTKPGGSVAFEVGEVRKGNLKLEIEVAEEALAAGFTLDGILINQQNFTKTANIWGVSNNTRGTNTNRVVVMRK